MANGINIVALVGNLTAAPELRMAGETPVCDLRLAVNGRQKRQGNWEDRADFFDVTVFGAQAENCAQYLGKGSPIAVTGRLRQDRWTNDSNENRSKVKIVANSIQFLQSKEQAQQQGQAQPQQQQQAPPQSELPADESDFAPESAGSEDDIPF